ncbi:hypothetical protein SDC9_184502 [bioreactor metagenome]|uniref:Uncharacterized protein n=1 Tax=bioreactor metagenome TaxID=1076179 RepID=A0A645HE43_9ZZZZ
MRSVFPEADEDMLNVFSPERAVEKRDVFGATGYKQVETQLDFWKKHLQEPLES